MNVDIALPPGYEALEPFVARFALSDLPARAAARSDATAEQRAAFYAAMQHRVEDALDLLDTKPLETFDPAEARLMDLCLAFAHIALAEEIHQDAEPGHAVLRAHLRITRANPAM